MSKKARERYTKGYVLGFLLISLIGTVLIVLAYSSAAHAAQVTLAWDVPVTGPPDGYRVFSRLEGQSYDYSEPAWQGSATTSTLSDLPNTTIHFVVRAYNSYGESDDSNEATYQSSTSPPTPTTQSSSGGGGGGGCLIAATAFGSDLCVHALLLLAGVGGVVAAVIGWRDGRRRSKTQRIEGR